MELAEKILDYVVWILIIGGMMWFAYGCYELVDLFFIRG
jgi:hypothetical protein